MNSYLPDYLKPKLLELQIQLPPRHHTQVNHTYLSLSSSPNQTPCRPPLGLIPRQGEKAPPSLGYTSQVPGRRHSSLPSSSPPTSGRSACYVALTPQSVFSSSIVLVVTVLVGAEVRHLSPGPLPPNCFTCLWSCFPLNPPPPASSMVHPECGFDLVTPLSEIY